VWWWSGDPNLSADTQIKETLMGSPRESYQKARNVGFGRLWKVYQRRRVLSIFLAGLAGGMGKNAVARLRPHTVIDLESARIVGGGWRVSLSGWYFFTATPLKGPAAWFDFDTHGRSAAGCSLAVSVGVFYPSRL